MRASEARAGRPAKVERAAEVGRPSKKAKGHQKKTLGIRATVDLANRLDREAKKSGRSLSEEASLRLERSFQAQDQAEIFSDYHFGPQLSGVLMAIGQALIDTGTHAVVQATGRIEAANSW